MQSDRSSAIAPAKSDHEAKTFRTGVASDPPHAGFLREHLTKDRVLLLQSQYLSYPRDRVGLAITKQELTRRRKR
jgi:hypothetical protein